MRRKARDKKTNSIILPLFVLVLLVSAVGRKKFACLMNKNID